MCRRRLPQISNPPATARVTSLCVPPLPISATLYIITCVCGWVTVPNGDDWSLADTLYMTAASAGSNALSIDTSNIKLISYERPVLFRLSFQRFHWHAHGTYQLGDLLDLTSHKRRVMSQVTSHGGSVTNSYVWINVKLFFCRSNAEN